MVFYVGAHANASDTRGALRTSASATAVAVLFAATVVAAAFAAAVAVASAAAVAAAFAAAVAVSFAAAVVAAASGVCVGVGVSSQTTSNVSGSHSQLSPWCRSPGP